LRSILFHIPAEIAGVPVFGVGWLLFLWIAVVLAALTWSAWQAGSFREIAGYVPFALIVAAVVAFLLPNMVDMGSEGMPLGVPVRGFGVMLMLATIAGVGLAAYRAWQVGHDPDVIYSLAFVMFIGGIIGARLFYVVQYWNQFVQFAPGGALDIGRTMRAILNVTEGGLVVYGSLLLGLPAAIWFCRKRGLPFFAVGDIIAPGMALGLALGRVGCFLNGCCFGGVTLTAACAVTFPGPPAPSPPYIQHEQAGWRSGVWLSERDGDVVIDYIASRGSTQPPGLAAGDRITAINGKAVESLSDARQALSAGSTSYEVQTSDGRIVRWTAKPPPRSVPVHPAQLYAAIDAGLLASVLWFFYPFRRRDGEVFALLLTLHPISRFFLEMIRSDEPGRFGTELTISQWLSLALLGAACVLWWYIESGSKFKVQSSTFQQPGSK
jgi:phosphatidylglycerol:prolipoprotein diacylglycerol transferase